MGKKTTATSASKISSASSLAAPSSTISSQRSSILKSSFAPSYLQLRLFASVIQSFDSQQLRIHDITNSRLKHQHLARPAARITCLDWGYYGDAYRESRLPKSKKRKRVREATEDVVVAYGTSTAEICMYSPVEDKVVGTLRGAHEGSIRDFKFLESDNLQAWTAGDDGKLVQWDLGANQAVRKISLPDPSVQVLTSPSLQSPQIICASFTPFSINLISSDDFRIQSYDKFRHPVQALLRSGSTSNATETFLAVDDDRYINIFDTTQQKIVRTLISNGEVERVSLFDPQKQTKNPIQEQLLAVVTREGLVELFARPFLLPVYVNGDLKSKRKGMTRKADASIKLVNPDGNGKMVSIHHASFQGPDLYIVSVEGGVEPSFQKLRWQDEGSGELLFEGIKEVPLIKNASTLNSVTMNGAKDVGKTNVDESRVVVGNGIAQPGSEVGAIEITSSEDEDDEDDEDGEDDQKDIHQSEDEHEDSDAESSGPSDADIEKTSENEAADQNDEEMQDAEGEEPTFGDMLAARHPETIAIADALPTDDNALTMLANPGQVAQLSGSSLGTVLSQALRTNDQSLLESCLHEVHEVTIQNTILRIDSSLAAILLVKIAERMADRPGRWGHLVHWVQSVLIVHGGAVGAQPNVASKLRTLYQVIDERSKALSPILLLKGKLDMLAAQQSFREQTEAQQRASRVDPNEPRTVYIEGRTDNWSSDEEMDEHVGHTSSTKTKSRKDLSALISDAESSDDEDMPLANGLSYSESENEDDDEDVHIQKPGGLLDDQAEESNEDDAEEEEEDNDTGDDEEDSGEEDSDDEVDSSMEDFINDGSISETSKKDDIDVDEEDTPQKPPTKRSKHR